MSDITCPYCHMPQAGLSTLSIHMKEYHEQAIRNEGVVPSPEKPNEDMQPKVPILDSDGNMIGLEPLAKPTDASTDWGKHIDRGDGFTHHAGDDCDPSNQGRTVAIYQTTDTSTDCETCAGVGWFYSNPEHTPPHHPCPNCKGTGKAFTPDQPQTCQYCDHKLSQHLESGGCSSPVCECPYIDQPQADELEDELRSQIWNHWRFGWNSALKGEHADKATPPELEQWVVNIKDLIARERQQAAIEALDKVEGSIPAYENRHPEWGDKKQEAAAIGYWEAVEDFRSRIATIKEQTNE